MVVGDIEEADASAEDGRFGMTELQPVTATEDTMKRRRSIQYLKHSSCLRSSLYLYDSGKLLSNAATEQYVALTRRLSARLYTECFSDSLRTVIRVTPRATGEFSASSAGVSPASQFMRGQCDLAGNVYEFANEHTDECSRDANESHAHIACRE